MRNEFHEVQGFFLLFMFSPLNRKISYHGESQHDPECPHFCVNAPTLDFVKLQPTKSVGTGTIHLPMQ